MEKKKLITLIENYDTGKTHKNLFALEDSELRTIAQRFISEERVILINETSNVLENV